MEVSRFLACLAADEGDLRDAVASVEPATPVPTCPGWTVSDLARHVASVYLSVVTVLRTGEWPHPWPPPALAAETPLAALGRAYGQLRTEFTARPPDEVALTWYEPDQSVALWVRRMTQETVIHRIDAELAAGLPLTPVPADLALDGVAEVLERFLAYGSATRPDRFASLAGEPLASHDGAITVLAGPRTWTIRPSPRDVTVTDGAAAADRARIEGSPAGVLRWLWGRAGDEAVQLSGDPVWAAYLRRLLAAATQ